MVRGIELRTQNRTTNNRKQMTIKQLKALSGKKFIRKTTGNGIEDIPAITEGIKKSASDQGLLSEYSEDEDAWHVGTWFMMKPKVRKSTLGTITFRSTSYLFEDECGNISQGTIPKSVAIFADSFEVGQFTYYLADA